MLYGLEPGLQKCFERHRAYKMFQELKLVFHTHAHGVCPLGPNRIGLGLWGPAPSFLLPSSSFLPLVVGLGKGEPNPSRSRIPPLGRTL